MRIGLGAIVVVGCGRFGFDPTLAPGDASDAGAAVDAPSCGPIVEMSDNFEAGNLGTRWSLQMQAGVTASETGGNLDISLITATGLNYTNVYSTLPYALSTCSVAITVVATPRVTAGTDCAFCLTVAGSPTQKLCFDISNGVIGSNLTVASQTMYTSRAFDPVGDAHLRFRQDATNVILETSSDGTNWTLFDQRPPPLDLTQIHPYVYAGTFQSVANPGTASYDNLIVQ